jgi:hypothetical protein
MVEIDIADFLITSVWLTLIYSSKFSHDYCMADIELADSHMTMAEVLGTSMNPPCTLLPNSVRSCRIVPSSLHPPL